MKTKQKKRKKPQELLPRQFVPITLGFLPLALERPLSSSRGIVLSLRRGVTELLGAVRKSAAVAPRAVPVLLPVDAHLRLHLRPIDPLAAGTESSATTTASVVIVGLVRGRRNRPMSCLGIVVNVVRLAVSRVGQLPPRGEHRLLGTKVSLLHSDRRLLLGRLITSLLFVRARVCVCMYVFVERERERDGVMIDSCTM